MRSVGVRIRDARKQYVADDPIVVSVEREGPAGNHSIPPEEVRSEDVQYPALHGMVSDKRALPRS